MVLVKMTQTRCSFLCDFLSRGRDSSVGSLFEVPHDAPGRRQPPLWETMLEFLWNYAKMQGSAL